jgi:TetR/AcrR family transcriptional repressor of mexJK operon
MVSAGAKTVREGSASKRAAILAAARELFLAEGYERTSVDAVSARAQVSKRTVYDYFGDKRALLLAVVEQSAESLLVAVQAAVDEELADGRDLEAALTAFAVRVATSTFGSADYAALLRLVQAESAHLPELRDHRLATAPEEAVAERLAAFGRAGLLEVPDPSREPGPACSGRA